MTRAVDDSSAGVFIDNTTVGGEGSSRIQQLLSIGGRIVSSAQG